MISEPLPASEAFVLARPDHPGFWTCRMDLREMVCDVYFVRRDGWTEDKLFVRFASGRGYDCLVDELPASEWLPIPNPWTNDEMTSPRK